MASFVERVKTGWNAFISQEQEVYRPTESAGYYSGYSSVSPSRTRVRISNERSIISSIYTRLSIDCAAIDLRHTRHDDADRYLSDVDSGLNDCLTVEANLDQGARAFRQDVFLSLFDKGVIAIVAVDTTLDPRLTGGYDVKTMRVGEVVQWFPNHVRVSLYNERIGLRQEVVLEKRSVAIVENPLYSVMNEPNSTLQRLIHKLNLLDSVDEATSSGKLDLIIQLPYVIKSEARRQQADQRRKEIEFQLKGSQYGIAYTDGTEKITQLNRPAENNLLEQITTLTNLLYTQLGLTPDIMNGNANEATMLNYNSRTIEPVVSAVVEALKRVFLTKTARAQGQSIDSFRNIFKITPLADITASFDVLARNEILTANEMRQVIGVKPSSEPKADTLINSNMPVDDTGVAIPGAGLTATEDPSVVAAATAPSDTSSLDNVNDAISAAFSTFGETPPANTAISPPSGDMDPDVILSSLDQLDKSVDSMFAGLGVGDAAS